MKTDNGIYVKVIEPFPLPLRIVTEEDYIAPYIQLIEHLIKRHAVNIIGGTPSDFRKEISNYIETIYQDGYSKGVKTANKICEL